MKNAKKLIMALALAAVLAFSVTAADFTPSVQQKQAPSIVTSNDSEGNDCVAIIKDANGKEVYSVKSGEIVVTSLAESNAKGGDVKKNLQSAYDQVNNAKSLTDLVPGLADLLKTEYKDVRSTDLVVRDLFDVSVIGTAAEYLAVDGNTISITFGIGVEKTLPLFVIHNTDGTNWELISGNNAVRNNDGSVTVTFNSLSPIGFVVVNTNLEVKDDTKSPQTFDAASLCVIGTIVAGAALVISKRRIER